MRTKPKKAFSALLCAVLAFGCCLACFAADPAAVPALKEKFIDAVGPEVNGLAVDYVYFAPANPRGEKLPLVVYFHGAGQGGKARAQIEENDFPLWAGEEIQRRFTGGGAWLLVPRSHEENDEFWSDNYVPAVKALIDDFIAKHAGEIDLSRIYAGGFSMGGKMTLKMASSYPSFFAAAFPLCPAYAPSRAQLEALADLPVWLIVSRFDVIAGYYTFSEEIWSTLSAVTRVPEKCRLTLFGRVKYPDGKNTPSNHFVWFALANDMFTCEGGAYPNAATVDALGNEITLTYPNGVVSWLCGHTSAYAGQPLSPNGTLEGNPDAGYGRGERVIKSLFPVVADMIKTFFTGLWQSFTGLFHK